MTANPEPAPSSTVRPHRGWALLALALAWVALVRAPLVLNARAHLDSDLAVDGLTLIDALNGRWRWHYPATPFIGSPPVLLSYVQARVWGPTPMALVSGGVVAYGLVVAGAYWLNRRAFGLSVAGWGLVPLAFASTGVIWLSGRLTGGHLLATAWHAGAFALLWGVLAKGGWRRSATLGLWCGFGLYIDSMFAVTCVGIGVAACVWAFSSSPLFRRVRSADRGVWGGRSGDGPHSGPYGKPGPAGGATSLTPGPSPGGRGEEEGKRSGRVLHAFACLFAFALAGGLGMAPRVIGKRVDPHDAYVGQFTPVVQADRVASNARILLLDCLPRLVAGHRLPGLQAEPDPSKLEGASPSSGRAKGVPWWELAATVVSLGLFGWSMLTLAFRETTPDPARAAIRLGLRVSTVAVLAGFLVHPSITDSDNYRYLVFLMVPWSSGFGLMMARLASKGRGGTWAAGLMALGCAGLMTVDSARWYARLGWINPSGLPIRKPVDDPALAWLEGHPEVSAVLADYWDAYRLSFLTIGRVKAVPFPQYPDRFPEIKGEVERLRDRVVVVRPGPFGPMYRAKALAAGGRELFQGRGLSIVEWPGGMSP
jgi:hypothetical protein